MKKMRRDVIFKNYTVKLKHLPTIIVEKVMKDVPCEIMKKYVRLDEPQMDKHLQAMNKVLMCDKKNAL